ncbi:YbbR-like domain-containing protein [Deinococcus hohokamensis]|uniref:YbbR-like domain-containing protein n=1 Tax=Deinococcus hohokamensis TaxID=309883 RepID=A0ABV9I6U6_9DEIO
MSGSPPEFWSRRRLARWLEPRYAWGRAMHNLPQKLLAVTASVALWLVATAERRANVEQGYDVPVSVRDTTGGRSTRATSALNPSTVRVTLSGRPERLREISPKNIEAVVDVTGVPEGSFTRPVRVSPPSGTALTRQDPDKIQGFVDTQLTRTLPVTLGVATPSESSLPRYAVSPAEVSVSGPGRVVGAVRQVVTSPSVIPAGTERELPLIALNAQGRPVEGVMTQPSTVTVRRLDTGELPVKNVPVVLNPPPAALRVTSVSVQPSSVRLVAAPELLARLREVAGTVVYRAGTYTAPVTLRLPAGAQALEEVTVRLTVVPATPPAAPEGSAPPSEDQGPAKSVPATSAAPAAATPASGSPRPPAP